MFWTLTPREAGVIRDGQVRRIRREQDERKHLTYAAGALARAAQHAKKFPRYEKVFPERKTRRQTVEEMMAAMRQWSDVIEKASRRGA